MIYTNPGDRFIRLDALKPGTKAGTTRCTPGKTVPCGRVCRKPQNCAKGKGVNERKARIGEEGLKTFTEARRAELEAKKQSKQPISSKVQSALVKVRSAKAKDNGFDDVDPSIRKFAGKPPTDETVKEMVMAHAQKPLSQEEGKALYWRSLENQYKTKDKKEIYQRYRDHIVESNEVLADGDRRSLEKARQKLKTTKSDKVRAKAERDVKRLEKEVSEWEKTSDRWRNMSDADLDKGMDNWARQWTEEMNGHINSDNPNKKEVAGYTIATIKTGWIKSDFINTSGFGRGTEVADKHLKDVIRSMSDSSPLGITGKPNSAEELKAAYRKAAQKAHPDAGGSAEKFQEVKEAYESMKRRYKFDSFYWGITFDYS